MGTDVKKWFHQAEEIADQSPGIRGQPRRGLIPPVPGKEAAGAAGAPAATGGVVI